MMERENQGLSGICPEWENKRQKDCNTVADIHFFVLADILKEMADTMVYDDTSKKDS